MKLFPRLDLKQLIGRIALAASAAAAPLILAATPLGASAQVLGGVEAAATGPIQLRQLNPGPAPSNPTTPAIGTGQAGLQSQGTSLLQNMQPAPNAARPRMEQAAPGEFELYIRSRAGNVNIGRLGADWLEGLGEDRDSADQTPPVPSDYVVQAGDELLVTIWGSVEADLRLQVDRSGRISIPRVGPIMVAGMRYGELGDLVTRRIAQVFKNFQASVALGRLRGIQVYVTGFVVRPGSVLVNGLSTISQALAKAGGPAASGTYRQIQLRRGRDTVATFDLYDLLLKGDRTADRTLQPGDVVYVGPVAQQAAILGSVNRPTIVELRPGETLEDVLRMAGGLSAVADASRVTLERVEDRLTTRMRELPLPASARQTLSNGDVVYVTSAVGAALPVLRQNKRVRIEGEVARPGDYLLPPESTLRDALQAAGGIVGSAFVYGTEFTRESVRRNQMANYDRALRDLEDRLSRNLNGQSAPNSAVDAANQRLLERLRAVRPTGRVVLELAIDSTELPALSVEDNDRIYIPAKPTTVGVFGSVFNGGSYLYTDRRRVDDYLKLAGGATRDADEGSAFVVRANGAVVSALQSGGGGWFASGSPLTQVPAQPGDTIFLPTDVGRVTFLQGIKDWTQVVYQFGLGAAGLKAAFR